MGSHERSRKEMRRCATVKEKISFGPTTMIFGACQRGTKVEEAPKFDLPFPVHGTAGSGEERESSFRAQVM